MNSCEHPGSRGVSIINVFGVYKSGHERLIHRKDETGIMGSMNRYGDRERTTEHEASAFVPGHVTAFFSVHRGENPETTGSRGAGITLSDGVTIGVKPTEETRVSLDGEKAEVRPVERVLDAMGVTARVRIDTELPVGAGFGVSGAAALGTALAANRAARCGYTENELVRTAHVAEVRAGTGLGDVVAQARGGAPVRLEPGAPEHGVLDGVAETARIEYASFGDLSTSEVISGGTERLSRAGEEALSELRERPTLPRMLALGREFARETELLVPEVATAIEDVGDVGGEATMAMLGRTVVALGSGLTDAGYDATACRIYPGCETLARGRVSPPGDHRDTGDG
jgi:pantoate kinase